MKNRYDVIIIGGGFFGMYVAEYFALQGKRVILCEKEADFMQRASYVNQARVHNGYHYPRSILTALRSHVSFPRFCQEFDNCIDSSFEQYYMIGRLLGKVTAKQYEKFCLSIGVPCEPAPKRITKLINPNYIEAAYLTNEFAFDAIKLKDVMHARLDDAGVIYRFNTEVCSIRSGQNGLDVRIQGTDGNVHPEVISSRQVFNCTYSMLNHVLTGSGIEPIPLKHEMTEMCLVELPDVLKNTGITVMCGPFFSIMPFPPMNGIHIFSHVRYTPHFEWYDGKGQSPVNAHDLFQRAEKKSAWKAMLLDAQRYIPILSECKYDDSLWEVKTVLPRSETDDSRPILFKPDYHLKGFHCIMGGKIDNVYDVIREIEKLGLNV
ncbi:NAD(P)/FAD-dependent oxidoreductase [Nitrospirota bacterium]